MRTEKKIGKIRFRLLQPDTIRRMSVLRVVVPDIYDDEGYPIEGGLVDLKMGVVNPGMRCKTCGGTKDTCPGHFGHIELVRPVIHVGYAKDIYDILRSTCGECGRITLKEDKIEKIEDSPTEGIYQFREIRDKAKKKDECPYCGAEQKKITLTKPTSYFEGEGSAKQRLRPSEVRERLERIPREHLEALNIDPDLNRPEWFVLTVLPVPPVTTRPSITLESGNRSEDDLTHKLTDLLRINQRLADNISAGAPQPIIEDLWDLLQYHITTYFNNKVSGIPPAKQRSGRALNTLFQRIKGKHGRIKGNLISKRVNFSARGVISPDTALSIGEVGVPQEIAKELTLPIKVTEKNITEMINYIRSEEYPMALYVKTPDGKKKKITDMNRETLAEEIQPGYTVRRQLITGDITLFNRQPSLHRLSMQAHRARVMHGKTLRINDGIAKPYNADFDGDAMNLHVPQTVEAQVEARELLAVKENIISPRHGQVLAGGHDHVSGLALMTQENATFTKEETLKLLKSVNINRLPNGKDKKEYHGREIISEIIPDTITLEIPSQLSEKPVKIEKGQVKEGIMDEKCFGGEGILTREIWDKEGSDRAEKFINDITRLTLESITMKGYTISLEEYSLTEKGEKKRQETVDKGIGTAKEFIKKYEEGKLEALPGKTERETLEAMIMDQMEKINKKTWEIALKDLGMDNYGVVMAKSGARGSWRNVTQMTCVVGQMGIRGERLERGYQGRVLPHFKKGDLSPRVKGFIPSSFSKGLRPEEAYQQSMSGRDSLIDKGINPAESGYLYKKIANALLDINVKEDLTVTDAAGKIIQFKYGEDGLNPMKARD